MPVLDDPNGNANAGITAGVSDRPVRAYQWLCSNPSCSSPNQIGRVEDGCQSCGAGADGIQATPLPPTNFNCQACKGTGTVERKCGRCDGTGAVDAPSLGEPPAACEKCGGAGTMAFGCGRCDGSGIDPEPAMGPVAKAEETSLKPPVASAAVPPAGIPAMPRTPAPSISGLPSIDDGPERLDRGDVVRYRLIRYEGPADAVDQNMAISLNGCVSPGVVKLTAMEVAEPKSAQVQERLKALEGAPARWDVKDRKFRGDRG